MEYIIQLLGAILMGTAIGSALGPRNKALFIGSLVAVALGILTLILASWVPLAIGTAIYLVAQGMQRDNRPSRA